MEGFLVFGVAVLVVLGTSLIKNVSMSDRAKNLIAVVLSTIGGIITDLSTRAFDFSTYEGLDILGTVLVIYGAAQLIYQFIMKDTSADAKLESIKVLPEGTGQ
jgi:hypothetical protein